MKVKFRVFVIAILAAVLAGCNHNVEEEKLYEFTINVQTDIDSGISNALNEAYENETGLYARTANPEVPANVYYTVTASKVGGGHDDVESFWEGDNKYTIRLPEGTWSVVAKAYATESSGAFSTQIFQSSELELLVNDELASSNNAFNIVVHPILTADKDLANESSSGTVALPFSVAGDSNIVHAVARWQDGSQDFTFSQTNTSAILYMGDAANTPVSSGSHSVSFSFYKEDNSGNEYLCYYFTETINVFANLKTTKWIRASERASYMDADGNILITAALVSAFEKNTIYVDGNLGSNTASGSFFSPFLTVQKAVDVILKMNTGAENERYVIVLKSDIAGSGTSFAAADNQALINIVPDAALNLTVFSYGTDVKTINANRSASATGRVMYIGSNAAVTLENVALTGGYITSGNGAGIDVEGSLSIQGEISVYGNTSGTSDNNIYLPVKADSTQKTLEIIGALTLHHVIENEIEVVKKTGIKTAEIPVSDTPMVVFTTGFTSKSNSSTPSTFFVSDDDYAIGLNNSEGVVATTLLSFNPEIMKNVTFTLSGSTTISQSSGGIITVSANSGEINVTESITEWLISVTNGGGTVPVSDATEIGDTATVSINNNQIIFHKGLPEGTYQVQVTAFYSVDGQTAQAKDGLTFDVEINE